MLLRQLLDKESCTLTYVLAEDYQSPAVIIDPVLEQLELYHRLLREWKLELIYCIDTHTHADHITASGKLAKHYGAKIVVGEQSPALCANVRVKNGNTLFIGNIPLHVLYTPGHTDDCYCYAADGLVFTGDTLFIRGTGRTDFQSGSAAAAYRSITQKLFTLPDETIVYPGHDYKGMMLSTIGEEKRFNPRLQVNSLEEYVNIMDRLNLSYPAKMDIALPANIQCGLTES